jgi:hypothetical protein
LQEKEGKKMEISLEVIYWIFAILTAIVYGFLYNLLTERLEQIKADHGYTAILVVGGVMGTLLIAVLVVGLVPALKVVAIFCVTGLPMTIGSINRHLQAESIQAAQAAKDAQELLADD